MQEHLGTGKRRDLVYATDVIGVAVRAHDPRDVLEGSADSREVRAEEPRRSGVASVDERDLVAVDEQVRLRPDEPYDMDVW
jgi:hypothetical protein